MHDQNEQHQTIVKGARFVGAVTGFVFMGVGLTVLVFLWSQPFGGFGSPPLFFRIFGSFVAIPFMAIGGFSAFAALTGKPRGKLNMMNSNTVPSSGDSAKQGTYSCPKCNASLSDGVEVSPSGDVKCEYCKSWFNIHHA